MSHYFVIVNPASGYKKGLTILDKIRKDFLNYGNELSVAISEYKNHPFELIKNADLTNIKAICVIGGDGTMHEVINGLLKRADKIRLPIGLIPAGTGNSLMHDMDCLDPDVAVQKIINNKKHKLDIFEININSSIIYGFNILGWGIPVDINTLAEKMRWLKGQRYNVASIFEVFKNRTRNVRITIDNEVFEGQYGFFLACNTKYTGNGMKMAPMALIDDGYINILVAKKVNRLRLFYLFAKVFSGNHVNDSSIMWFKAKSFSVWTSSPHSLNIDGQDIGSTPFNARILSEQLEIFA